jgi:hypothetical protein
MYPNFLIISWLITGIISAFIAYKKQKNIYLWFFIGFVLGIFGIVILLFLYKKPKSKEVKIEAPLEDEEHDNFFWYYLDEENKTIGPMSHSVLKNNFNIGKINNNTYIWNDSMSSWVFFKDVFKKTTNLPS